MTERRFTAALLVALVSAALQSGAVEWRNVDDAHRVGGRKMSSGYLQGKVVLVYRQEAAPALLQRMEAVWNSFKTKQFVLLGSGSSADEGASTFAMYRDAGLAVDEPEGAAIYVVDSTGSVKYRGSDERRATEVVVTALTDMDAPKNAAQWKRLVDAELANLPGRAYLRIQEFKKKFPAEAKAYDAAFKELSAIPDIKKLAELVAFAKQAKDMRTFDAKKKHLKAKFADKLKSALSKYAALVESKDPRVAQEAKNSIADIKWTQASL